MKCAGVHQVGDWGRLGQYNQTQVAALMGQKADVLQPDFVISTGDNFYPSERPPLTWPFVPLPYLSSCPVVLLLSPDGQTLREMDAEIIAMWEFLSVGGIGLRATVLQQWLVFHP